MPYYPEKKPLLSGEEAKQHEKTAVKRRKLLCLSLAVGSCLLIGYGAARLILYYSDLAASGQTRRELQEIREQAEVLSPSPAPVPAETAAPDISTPQPDRKAADASLLPPMAYPDNPDLKISDSFTALRKKNSYIVG